MTTSPEQNNDRSQNENDENKNNNNNNESLDLKRKRSAIYNKDSEIEPSSKKQKLNNDGFNDCNKNEKEQTNDDKNDGKSLKSISSLTNQSQITEENKVNPSKKPTSSNLEEKNVVVGVESTMNNNHNGSKNSQQSNKNINGNTGK